MKDRNEKTRRIINHRGYFTIGALDPSAIGDIVTDLVDLDGTPVPFPFRIIGVGSLEEAQVQREYVGGDRDSVSKFPYFYRVITD